MYVLMASLVFGFLSRVIGAKKGSILPSWFNPIKDWVYATPYGLIGILCFYGYGYSTSFLAFLVCFLVAFLGKRTGHGQWMDLGTWDAPVSPESLDFLVFFILGKDSYKSYWRDFLGLTISGIFISLGCVISLLLINQYLLALLVLLGGALKSVSYAIGFKVFKSKYPTEVGEFLTGFFAGIPIFYTIGVLLHVHIN